MRVFFERAFEENLVWMLENDQGTVVVDPGRLTPLLQKRLKADADRLKAILLTHRHADHCAGVQDLLSIAPNALIYGPEECSSWTEGKLCLLQGGEHIQLLGLSIAVLPASGHTTGHLVYYCSPYLWSGDTWFVWGCGRCFDEPSEQLYCTLSHLQRLPSSTLLCPGHDYAASNLQFLYALDPLAKKSEALICCSHSIQTDQKLNPFLRTQDPAFARRVGWTGPLGAPFFSWLRQIKDRF